MANKNIGWSKKFAQEKANFCNEYLKEVNAYVQRENYLYPHKTTHQWIVVLQKKVEKYK